MMAVRVLNCRKLTVNFFTFCSLLPLIRHQSDYKMSTTWKKIAVSRADLQLKSTLNGGQSFRWRNPKTDYWIGVFRNLVWILLQEDDFISYRCIGKAMNSSKNVKTLDNNRAGESLYQDPGELLVNYLRLNVDLNHYYQVWSQADPNFQKLAPRMFGTRILNQEVTENIFSFICSSNNNIKRISSMVEKLCEFYGDPIAEVDGQNYFSFPKVDKLTQPSVESKLREAGFGYRAKFIHQSACTIKDLGGSAWLNNLKKMPYKMAREELMKLPGVGAKVADCICLMSLGHLEAIPVDTHIFKVASDIYLPHLKNYKTLSDKVYNQIGDHFRSLHGNYAGWANTILFCADLKQLQGMTNEKSEPEKNDKTDKRKKK